MNKKKKLIEEIDSFWDTISRAGLVFKLGAHSYYDGHLDRLKDRLVEISDLEKEADSLRRDIKHKLYSEMLIPDARGDVLGLLETSDNVIDRTKKIMVALDIEKPVTPSSFVPDFKELIELSADAVDEMVKANRAFFSDLKIINDFINKVYFYEHEADEMEERIKRRAFETKEITHLSCRVQMRYFAERISQLADDAEAVCERLSVYAIKRSL
jgi:predicted phosphate transport protein (TIGR00153 family)